jgi:hypothetical protein
MNKGGGKYEARDGQIVKRSTGEPIPEDEPIFILRARDRLAYERLLEYQKAALLDGCTQYHLDGVAEAIEWFQKFRTMHPDRMKQPGVTLGL